MENPCIVDVRDAVVPIAADISNAFIDFRRMTASVVAVVSNVERNGHRLAGFGFNSNGRYAAQGLLRERFIPRLRDADPTSILDDSGENFDPARAWDVMMTGEKPGGHGERSVAIGVLDMALWDLVAKIEGRPLYRLLADRFNRGLASNRVWVYAAGGYYQSDKGLAALQDEMRSYLDRGFMTVKMKIGGAPLSEDLERIEAVLELLGGDGSRLAVDANGRFDQDEALAYADALEPYGLAWYEEPGDPLDFELLEQVAARYDPPLATGENLFSMADARNLIRYGGMRPDRDVLQFDPALSYGLVEYLRTLEMIEENGWSRTRCVPHGGHLFATHIAAGLGLGGNEAYPDVFQPFGGFPSDVVIEDGQVSMPERPGIGYEGMPDLYSVFDNLLRD